MSSVCNAYVADASPPERRAVNLGIFQGVSVAGKPARVANVGPRPTRLPVARLLAARRVHVPCVPGPQVRSSSASRSRRSSTPSMGCARPCTSLPRWACSTLCSFYSWCPSRCLRSSARCGFPPDLAAMHVPCPCDARHAHASACCLHAVHVSSTWHAHALQGKKLDLRSANPLGALNLLLGRSGIMRGSAAAYFLVWLGNACINSQFGNYVNHLFGWGPQESAPLLVPAWSDHQTRTRALARASANLGPNRALVCEAVEPSAAPRLSPSGTARASCTSSLPRLVRRCSSA